MLAIWLVSASVVYIGGEFLGNWLYDGGFWYLGAPVRLFQLLVMLTTLGFVVYWLYATGKGLITGKEPFED